MKGHDFPTHKKAGLVGGQREKKRETGEGKKKKRVPINREGRFCEKGETRVMTWKKKTRRGGRRGKQYYTFGRKNGRFPR